MLLNLFRRFSSTKFFHILKLSPLLASFGMSLSLSCASEGAHFIPEEGQAYSQAKLFSSEADGPKSALPSLFSAIPFDIQSRLILNFLRTKDISSYALTCQNFNSNLHRTLKICENLISDSNPQIPRGDFINLYIKYVITNPLITAEDFKNRFSNIGYIKSEIELYDVQKSTEENFLLSIKRNKKYLAFYCLLKEVAPNKANKGMYSRLHRVCQQKYADLLELLIFQGGDIRVKSQDGTALVHVAARKNSPIILHMLSKRGADLDARTNDMRTPLHLACQKGRFDVIEWLVSQGVDLNAQDKYGKTPLHFSCQRSFRKIIAFLVKSGANPNIIDINRQSPLHDAAHHSSPFIIQFLLENGAEPNQKAIGSGELTPLKYAERYGYLKNQKILQQWEEKLNNPSQK